MGFVSWVWDRSRAATSTLHVRPGSWWLLFSLQFLSMFVALFLGFYCASPDRCPSKGYWPARVWGKFGENPCPDYAAGEGSWLCEKCEKSNLLHSPVGALSTVSFVMVGWIILVWGVEDIHYFHFSESTVVHPMQDYTRHSTPSLILAGSGMFHILLVILGSLCLHYAGIGAFLYHASFTPVGAKYDLASVWTLTTIILPYCFFNHFSPFLKDNYWGCRVLMFLTAVLMILMFILPCTCEFALLFFSKFH